MVYLFSTKYYQVLLVTKTRDITVFQGLKVYNVQQYCSNNHQHNCQNCTQKVFVYIKQCCFAAVLLALLNIYCDSYRPVNNKFFFYFAQSFFSVFCELFVCLFFFFSHGVVSLFLFMSLYVPLVSFATHNVITKYI